MSDRRNPSTNVGFDGTEDRPAPERLPTGERPRDVAGLPWWRYQRPEPPAPRGWPDAAAPAPPRRGSVPPPLVPAGAPAAAPPLAAATFAAGTTLPPAPAPVAARPAPALPIGRGFVGGLLAALLCGGAAMAVGNFSDSLVLVRVLVGACGLAIAYALAQYVQSRHPEEPWIGRYIVWGMVVKILATLARYQVFTGSDKRSDAIQYNKYGVDYVAGIAEPLADLRKTNFIKYLTAHVYVLLGPDLIAAFLVFGIFAFIGAYLWYRATAEGVPSLNRQMYCALLFFAPSLAFWPSSVSKEAVMLPALGLGALGTAYLLKGRLMRGFLVAAPGGYLLWAVRPHLLVFMVFAAGGAFLVRRGGTSKAGNASLRRPIGLALLAVLGVFAVGQATQFLGMKDFSLDSIQQELADQSVNTAQGNSAFEPKPVHLTPLSLPQGAVTVLLRPFPWEVENSTQLIASLESGVFALLVVVRFRSLTASLRQFRTSPFLFFCWVLLAFYAIAFSSFSNMGLLVRQRSLILPAFFALISVEPMREPDRLPPVPDALRAESAGAGAP